MTRIAITAGATAGNGRRAATHYNGRGIEDVLGSGYTTQHGEEVLEYTFSFDDQPVGGLDAAIPRIPALARIVSAEIKVLTAGVGFTTLDVGLIEPDGTTIDVDGLDVDIAVAALAAGATIAMDGALVGTVVTPQSQLIVANVGGTATAGKYRIRIVYDPQRDRA